MKTRIIAAAVALPLFLIVLLVPVTWPTLILLSGMCAIGAMELLKTTGLVKNIRLVIEAMLSAVVVCVWGWLGCPAWLGFGWLLVFFLILAFELLASHAKLPFQAIACTAFAGLVMPLLLSALLRIRCMEDGAYFVLMPLVLAFVADSGAYFAGRFFGRHKLAPIISPKKTIEGAVGGVICTVIFVMLYGLVLQVAFHFHVNYLAGLVYSVLGSTISIVGDLTYSVIKRQVGIKDYGNVLPGHGGILDRFDSMSLVAPLTECLMLVLPFAL